MTKPLDLAAIRSAFESGDIDALRRMGAAAQPASAPRAVPAGTPAAANPGPHPVADEDLDGDQLARFLRRTRTDRGMYAVLYKPRVGKAKPVNNIRSLDELLATARRLVRASIPADIWGAPASFDGPRKQENARELATLWLDTDPKDFDGGKEAILAALDRFCADTDIPAPAIMVDSGSGYHFYWPLTAPLARAEWQPLADGLKALCEANGFPADHTCTADAARVLRLPGTFNMKFDPPRPCAVVRDDGRSFDPAELRVVLCRESEKALDHAAKPAKAADLARNDDLTAGLYERLDRDTVQSMLAHVSGAERPQWLNVGMALHDWDEGGEEGFELFHTWSQTQPKYVSEADCRERWDSFGKRRNGERVTIGTLVKLARDGGWTRALPEPELESDAPTLANPGARPTVTQLPPFTPGNDAAAWAWFLKRFVYVRHLSAYYDRETKEVLEPRTLDEGWSYLLKHAQQKNARLLLKGSEHTVRVQHLRYHPGEGDVFVDSVDNAHCANVYRKPIGLWRLPADPTVIAVWNALMDWSFPLAADAVSRENFQDRLAYGLQHPGTPLHTAMVFISDMQGSGKTTLAYEVPRWLFGTWNVRKVSEGEIESSFSDWLGETQVLVFEEIHTANGRRDSQAVSDRLKDPLTSETLHIHPKGSKGYDVPNRLMVFASSNYINAVWLPEHDRRWWVHRMPEAKMPRSLARKIYAVLHSESGRAMLRDILLRRDLSKFDRHAEPPITIGKQQMLDESLSDLEQELKYRAEQRIAPLDKDLVQLKPLAAEIGQIPQYRYITERKLGPVLKKLFNAHTLKCRIGLPGSLEKIIRVHVIRNHDQWPDGTPGARVFEHLRSETPEFDEPLPSEATSPGAVH